MTKEEANKIAKDIRENSSGKRYKNENFKGLKFRLMEANPEKVIAERWDVQIKFSINRGISELAGQEQKCYFKEFIADYIPL